MSVDVGTKWYKAPEILYGARTYNSSVDIWSAGCILAELLDTTPLFTGFNDLDQMARIANFIGNPTDDFLNQLPNNHFRVKSALNTNDSGTDLTSHFNSKPKQALDLLLKMLQYCNRPSASDCLEHPWFV